MKESPRWLVIQGRLGDAKKILLQISRGGGKGGRGGAPAPPELSNFFNYIT